MGGKRLTYAETVELKRKVEEEGLALCRRCNHFLSLDNFRKGPEENFGIWYYCKECDKRDYLKAKENGTANYTVKKRNRELKTQFVELAGGCCQKCGYKESIAALDFHHVDPQCKDSEIMRLIYRNKYEETYKEIDKCCLLCANCHRTYTAMEWVCIWVKREGLGYTIQADSIQYGEHWVPESISVSVDIW